MPGEAVINNITSEPIRRPTSYNRANVGTRRISSEYCCRLRTPTLAAGQANRPKPTHKITGRQSRHILTPFRNFSSSTIGSGFPFFSPPGLPPPCIDTLLLRTP